MTEYIYIYIYAMYRPIEDM